MPEAVVGASAVGSTQPNNAELSGSAFNALCSHYKDTCDILFAAIKQREFLFYGFLIILALFSFQFSSAGLVDELFNNYLKDELHISVEKNSNLLGELLWFLLFGVSSRYYQTTVSIERQYKYIHHLEDVLTARYPAGLKVFTREGKDYSRQHPMFTGWIGFIYKTAFPIMVLLSIVIRIREELNHYEALGASVLLEFVCYLMVGTSTVLYFLAMHRKFLRQCRGNATGILEWFKQQIISF